MSQQYFRGDTIRIPISLVFDPTDTIRVQMRRSPDDEFFYLLFIEAGYIVITPEQSRTMDGTYICEVETTSASGVVTTHPSREVFIKKDTVRTDGSEVASQPLSDFERHIIIAESFKQRLPGGDVIDFAIQGIQGERGPRGYTDDYPFVVNRTGAATVAKTTGHILTVDGVSSLYLGLGEQNVVILQNGVPEGEEVNVNLINT